MNRFPNLDAVREHLRTPTEAMFTGGREKRENRTAQPKTWVECIRPDGDSAF